MPRTEAADDRETPGVLYNSRIASAGEVVWYSPIDTEEQAVITFRLPERYATAELYDRLEELAGWLVDENASGKRPTLTLVTRE